MSFTEEQYRDCFEMAEFVYLSIKTVAVRGSELQNIKESAQKMMLAVEDTIGQLRTGEERARLGLGDKPGELLK